MLRTSQLRAQAKERVGASFAVRLGTLPTVRIESFARTLAAMFGVSFDRFPAGQARGGCGHERPVMAHDPPRRARRVGSSLTLPAVSTAQDKTRLIRHRQLPSDLP